MDPETQDSSSHIPATQPVGYEPVEPFWGGKKQAKKPTKQTITSEMEARHKESMAKFPNLRLSKGEYVIKAVRRHPIGLFSIWFIVGLIIVLTFVILPIYSVTQEAIARTLMLKPNQLPSPAVLALPMLFTSALFVLGGIVATIVYNGNKFYLTNESIIQFIQTSLFNTKEQHINLVNVEDASYHQAGILQQLLNYGTIRMSTEGDETTYLFEYATRPQEVVRLVTEASEDASGNAVRHRNNQF